MTIRETDKPRDNNKETTTEMRREATTTTIKITTEMRDNTKSQAEEVL